MPQLSETSVQILDRLITLTQRDRSSMWQARFRIGERWYRVTTKQRDLEEAKRVAEDQYLHAKYRHKDGQPVLSKLFSQVALLAKQQMQTQIDNGDGKAVFKDYIIAINKYLIPFFGKYLITNIDNELLKKFDEWRTQQLGHVAKQSSINTHNSALNRIFDEALERGYMTKSQLPYLKNKGVKSDRRPDFTLDEYKKLLRFIPKWIKRGREGKSRMMRELLLDYVLILGNTGMRHGTESLGIKWKHISFHTEKTQDVSQSYLVFHVDGKTGGRELIARHNVLRYLQRIHSNTDDIKDVSFDYLIKHGYDQLVFRLRDGSTTTAASLAQLFEALLMESGLLVDRRTESNRTLYSLRHTYATLALVGSGMSIHLLAEQMGTSVGMIEQHYSHLTPRMKARELAGADYLQRSLELKKNAMQKTSTVQQEAR